MLVLKPLLDAQVIPGGEGPQFTDGLERNFALPGRVLRPTLPRANGRAHYPREGEIEHGHDSPEPMRGKMPTRVDSCLRRNDGRARE